MISWIDVNDRMPDQELPKCRWPYRHYLVLMRSKIGYIMGIARYYDGSKDLKEGPLWYPINYNNEFVFGYKLGGMEEDGSICPHDYNYYFGCAYDTCNPVVVTHWSPIEWIEPCKNIADEE